MTLGIALVVIFILYLIDKHNRWRQAVKIVGALLALGVIAFGIFYAYAAYTDSRAKKAQEAYTAKMQPVWNCEYRNTSGDESMAGLPYEPYNVTSFVKNACEKDPTTVVPSFIPDPYAVAPPAPAPRTKTILELNHVRWINPNTVNGVSISDDAEQLKCGDGNGAVLGEIMFISGAWVVSYGPDKWDMTVKHGTKAKAQQDVQEHADFDLCKE